MSASIIDIAREDGAKLARESLAVKAGIRDQFQVEQHFTEKRFKELYRAHISRTRKRPASNRECMLAMDEAMKDAG